MREVRERERVELRNNHLTGSGHFLLAHLLADAGQLRDIIEAVLELVEVLASVFELGQQVGVTSPTRVRIRPDRWAPLCSAWPMSLANARM